MIYQLTGIRTRLAERVRTKINTPYLEGSQLGLKITLSGYCWNFCRGIVGTFAQRGGLGSWSVLRSRRSLAFELIPVIIIDLLN